ncbi:hypothetical protein ABZ215_24705 [Amycolatopsis sp. NPDC006131]|uniref:hypothetical protein n=1 Tax=Amycolatopsis sp. NPDC006131 TaxID=3156731 RepID=UPI0033AC39E8
MAKTSLTVKMSIVGLRPTLRAFNDLPKDATKRLKDATLELSRALAAKVKAEGMADEAPQSRLVATTVAAVRDRVPAIRAGGTKRLGRNRAPAYKLLFGSVFGSNYYRQFGRPHQGRDAYWFFPVVENSQAEIAAKWTAVADGIIRDFSEDA